MTGRARVIVASTSSAAGTSTDTTGPVIVEWLRTRGLSAPDPVVVADGIAVHDALVAAIDDDASVVVTTGGTGVTLDDVTPEMTAPLLHKELPGVAEEMRRRGLAHTPTAMLSRGLVGIAERTLIVNLPGSPGAVRDGLEVLDGVLAHILDLIRSTHIRGQ